MGVELECYVLLTVLILGSSIFAVFELETTWWRKALKIVTAFDRRPLLRCGSVRIACSRWSRSIGNIISLLVVL